MLLLDTPTVQRPVLTGTHIAQVLHDDVTVVMHDFDEPRMQRGSAGPKDPGHRYLLTDRATVYLKVPVPEPGREAGIRIRVVDLTELTHRPVDPDGMGKLLEGKAVEWRVLADIGSEQLRAHPDWATLGFAGGQSPPAGHYAIYVDRAGKYRWRLHNDAGQNVANSGQGFDSRADCEAELRWMRQRASVVPIRSLDLE
ncbi:MAG: DUF1508 domain-containing protein [Gemmatimonadetes bacterium]|nr:DUF1508 domain-containing protein [Gemmatimonadota bacterium]